MKECGNIMNIGELFFCSRCLCKLDEESICTYCGYDPSDRIDQDALEEGFLLRNGRYQIGAVCKNDDSGYTYGAYDHLNERPCFIYELFPVNTAMRNKSNMCVLIGTTSNSKESILLNTIERSTNYFDENNTRYWIVSSPLP